MKIENFNLSIVSDFGKFFELFRSKLNDNLSVRCTLAFYQSFPMACTRSGPWKKTLTIRLQPVELDWRSDEDIEELLLEGFDEALDDSPAADVEYFEFDGPAVADDDLESFVLELSIAALS